MLQNSTEKRTFSHLSTPNSILLLIFEPGLIDIVYFKYTGSFSSSCYIMGKKNIKPLLRSSTFIGFDVATFTLKRHCI